MVMPPVTVTLYPISINWRIVTLSASVHSRPADWASHSR
jgi:hypothetical protein